MNTRKVIQRLEKAIGIDGHPRRLRDAIETELANHFGLLPLKAAEMAEILEKPVRETILKVAVERQNAGSVAILQLSRATDRTVVGTCYVEPGDSATVALLKARRLQINPLLQEIRKLSFDEFETFGARVLRELGATTVRAGLV